MKRKPARSLEEANRVIREQQMMIEQLSAQVSKLQRYLFGQSSERLPISIPGEDLFTEEAPEEKEEKSAPQEKRGDKEKPAQRSRSRRPLPGHLPRRTVEHDVPEADKCCAGCGCEKARIGEEVTEQLEYVPASLHVIRHVRARYACRKCQGGVVEAKRPMQPIEKGLCGPALLAQIAVAKYAEHQPLNRQEAFFRRHGVELSRSTMCTWMMEAAGLLRPLYRLLRKRVVAGRVTHSDDTGIPVLEKGKTHRAFLWTYVGDDQAPYTVYDFTWGRGREGPKAFLSGYEGYLQADAYAGYHAVYGTGRVQEVGCWAHARRKFFEARDTDCVRADEALARIGKLYGIERRAKGTGPEERRELRQAESVGLLKEFFAWAGETQLKVLPKSPLGQALAYAVSNREALCRYVEDGRLDIDNNDAERALRSVVVGRKNWMFTGSARGGEAAAIYYSLIESAKRSGAEVFAYLRDVFTRLPELPITRLEEMLPDRWKTAQTSTM